MNKKISFRLITVSLTVLLALIFSAPTPVFAAGTGTITGTVWDISLGTTISGATVTVVSGCTGGPVITNGSGVYTVTVSWTNPGGGSCTLRASKPGYGTSTQSRNINNGQTRTLDFAIDDITPPIVTVTFTPNGSNGWFRTNPATGTVTATDNESGIGTTGGSLVCNRISGTATVTLSGVTGLGTGTATGTITVSGQGTTTLSCIARDRHNNATTSATITVRIDSVNPGITFTNRTGTSGSNGWYTSNVIVNWFCTDATSGPVAPTVSQTLATEGAALSATGTCTDNAGNSASNTQTGIKIDKTGPTGVALTPTGTLGTNDWYTSNVTITTSGTETVSTPITCTGSQSQTTNTTGTVFNGSCTNNAGLTTNAAPLTVKRDATAPIITYTGRTSPNGNGWNSTDVTVNWSCSDAVSGVVSPTVSRTLTTEGLNQSATGTCTDNAGNTATDTQTGINIDKSGPTAVLTPTGTAGANGWFVGDVTITASGTDSLSTPVTCTADQFQTTDTSGTDFNGSCANAAGLTTNAAPLTVKRDATAPTGINVSADRGPDANGYYNHSFTATWTGTDTTSGVASCISTTYSGPDTTAGSLNGSCTDEAGNTSGNVAFNFMYDGTAPIITFVDRTTPNANGWNSTDVTVNWSCSDSVSGVVSASVSQTLTTEGVNQSATGTCTDNAGNTASDTQTGINIDKTGPTAILTPTGTAGANGWFVGDVTISTTGSDISTPVTCTADQYLTIDTPGSPFGGSCTNAAGLSTSATPLIVKRDATAPTSVDVSADRSPNVGGYYNAPFTATWTGSDATSGIASCTSTTYSGPDTASGSVNGACTDEAGNTSGNVAFNFMYDGTAPIITFVDRTAPNVNGWNSTDVTVNWSCSDAISGVVSPTVSQILTTEGANQSATGTCTDNAGNTATDTQTGINIDKTGPTAVLTPTGMAGTNGWFIGDVTIATSGSDISTPVTCTADQFQTTDTSGTNFNGSCTNAAGLTTSAAPLTLKRDATAPTGINVSADRGPDAGGYYNHSFTATWTGNDATSGIASCTSTTYSGPDTTAGSINGACTDEAGNTSGNVAFNFMYDGTAPIITFVNRTAPNANGWNNTDVTVNWSCADAISGVVSPTVSQTLTTEGANQSATGTCTNNAGNTATDTQTGINIDKTGPTAVLTFTGTAGTNGWFVGDVTISTSGADISSPVNCTADQFQTTDTPGTVFNGSCTNAAGLTTSAAPLTVKRDTVVPSVLATVDRAPDFNGWYNHPVTVTFNGSDATSGLSACDPAVVYSGPDSASASVSGSCTDVAGNSNSASVTFKYNGSGPTAVLTATGTLGANGWYIGNVTITTSGTDVLGGTVTCTGVQVQTTDTTGTVFNGSCTNEAGLTTNAAPLTVKRDTVAPAIAFFSRTAANGYGWNNTNVLVNWSCTDATSGPILPTITQTVSAEGIGQSASATCTDNAGHASAASTVNNINIDKTLPVITMADRSPAADASGWNYAPVTVTWTCSDALSGTVFSPISVTLSAEGANQAATGTCEDKAGNTNSSTEGNINITFLSLPPAQPTETVIVPPTAVPPTETQPPAAVAPTSTPVAPAAVPTQIAPVPSGQSSEEIPVPVTGEQETGSISAQTRYLLYGGIFVVGLGFLWLLFFLLGKKRQQERQ